MKLLLIVSIFLLGISPSLSTPFHGLVERNSVNTCSASYIQSAESHANHGPRSTISSLCSSLQNKYKTVTHSVYTKTITPKTTLATATTAPRRVTSETVTSQITQTSTDVEESTSYTTDYEILTETTIVETDTVTVTVPGRNLTPPKVKRNQAPCQQIESILSLHSGSATPFCSCYNTGPTSTKTVTCDGATTGTLVHVTSYTRTVAPTPSTAITTVVKTTEVITTVYFGTLATTTVTDDTIYSLTDIVTTTVSALPTYAGFLTVELEGSPYEANYAYLDYTETEFDSRPIQFTSNRGLAQMFSVDANGHLLSGAGTSSGEQGKFSLANSPGNNIFYMDSLVDIEESSESVVQPTCSVSPRTGGLTCYETAANDPRNQFSICPSISDYEGNIFMEGPFLVLDTQVNSACYETALFFDL